MRQRRKRRRTVRAREAKAVVGVAGSGNGSKCKRKRKGLGRDHGESMTQAGIADMLRGRVCTAGAVNSDTDPDSEGSEDEDRCRPRLRPGLRERHQREIEAMQGRVGRARAAAARQGRERRNGRRRLQKRASSPLWSEVLRRAMTPAWKRFALVSPSFGSYFVLKFAGVRSRVCCCSGMVLVRLVGTFSVICCRVPAGDTVGATGMRGALPVLLLDVIVVSLL